MRPKKRWWDYIDDYLRYRRWKKWKKKAAVAIYLGQIAECIGCNTPIIPGDFVAKPIVRGVPKLVHAGYHFRIKNSEMIFCETAGVGCGYWNGVHVIPCEESVAEKALRTGEIQSGTY